jgi:hypothetical protein
MYVGVLKVPMQFLSFYALPKSRSLVCSKSAQNHRSHIFQRNSKYLPICLAYFDTIIWRFNSGKKINGQLMLDSAISYTVNSSAAALEGMFIMRLIIHSLWSPRFGTEYVLLCVKDTEIWSFCEQVASLSLKDTIQSKLQIFQDELHNISRYFQVWGLFGRWRLAL